MVQNEQGCSYIVITYLIDSVMNNLLRILLESCPQLLRGHNFESLIKFFKLVETFPQLSYFLPFHVKFYLRTKILIYHIFPF